ncbi:MAG TPA: adenylate/guanylate cyclase domain-containing protein [Stellaceae bacterium]|nr:adenylate/guanylate cyclase domain-containing protein [Stellaceae bacterium]
MRADEDATMRALGACRAVIDGLVAEHRGRIANTAGDAVLAEFPSVADGLACALEMQQALAAENADAPAERRMQFRIGLHLGDVMTRDGDLFGDAVNIAARLEALAEPGGICVSAAVREHAGTRVAATFADLGAQRVKNIADPVHVFRVGPTLTHPVAPAPGSTLSRIAGEGVERHRRETGEGGSAALALPDKPSIAVLPFANMSSDPEQEFFADGIAEDVITALSRYPSLFVIARNSCFTYKGRAVDVKEVGRELGVRYVLEGSLRKSGNRIRVTAQLVEAETGNHLWAERYDRDLADIFAVQDEISQAVSIAIAPAVSQAEQQRAMRKPPGSLDAWAAYQQGLWHLGRAIRSSNDEARRLFERAIEFDPSFAASYAALARAIGYAGMHYGAMPAADAVRLNTEYARKAMDLDPRDADAMTGLSLALIWQGDLANAETRAIEALNINPNNAWAYACIGACLVFCGRHAEGRAALAKTERLNPFDDELADDIYRVLAQSHYFNRDYEECLEISRHRIRFRPEDPSANFHIARALAQLGRTDAARAALSRAVAVGFRWDPHNRRAFHSAEQHAHMLEGLRKAGWEG